MRNVGRKILLIMAVALLFWTNQASAAPIASLYNTGVNDSGVVLAGGAIDPHYKIGTSDPAYVFDGGYPIGPWVANSATSMWIAPTLNTYAGYEYIYTTTFNLTGYDAGTASITAYITADDEVTVKLNGAQVGVITGLSSLHELLINSGFVSGVNTLTFDVINSGGGPTGLRVDMTGTASPVPVPGALLLFGPGLAGLGLLRRRFMK